jgi:hypothetical protein
MPTLPVKFETIAIPYVGARILRGREGIAVAACTPAGEAPLILMADMQYRNSGSSLTNSIEAAMNHVIATMFFGQAPRDAHWIQLDSIGYFDEVLPAYGFDENRVVDVTWRPIGDRTADRFIREFGEKGEAVLQRITETPVMPAMENSQRPFVAGV